MDIIKLNELNFEKLIKLEDAKNYSFDKYKYKEKKDEDHIGEHQKITGFCTICEESSKQDGWKICEDESYQLKYISHGATSIDFIKAINTITGTNINTDTWNNDEPVMFIMENPSKDYGQYEECDNGQGYKKYPSKKWYWVDIKDIYNKRVTNGYPQCFGGGKYGSLIASIILSFQLKNAYVTNFVKCGLNDDNSNFKTTKDYSKECIENCCKSYLLEEINAVNPKIIFTFGSRVFDLAKLYNINTREDGSKIKMVSLPHPARQQAGFKKEYYDTLYFCLIAKWLINMNVVTADFCRQNLIEKYLKNFT